MIRLNLVPHLHLLLESLKTVQLSEYTVEYSVSLLMNLCMRSAGKQACIDLFGGGHVIAGRRTLSLLSELIKYDNHLVKTYAVSAIYSLISDHMLRSEARDIGLIQALESVKDDLNERFARQIEVVVGIIKDEKDNNADHVDTASEDGEEDDNEDHVCFF